MGSEVMLFQKDLVNIGQRKFFQASMFLFIPKNVNHRITTK